MRLSSLVFLPGDLLVSNEELVERVIRTSEFLSTHDERRVRARLSRLLLYNGAVSRYWTTSDDAVRDAVVTALSTSFNAAGVSPEEIDLLISTSVDRAVLEPSQAAVIANLAGLFGCQSFDVLEGCNGWLRGAQVAQALLDAGSVDRVALVSAEFPTTPGGLVRPEQLRLSRVAEIRQRFPAMTIGDGVAVVILEAGGDPWHFSFAARSDLLRLCYASLPTSRRFLADEMRESWADGMAFVADGPGLVMNADRALHELVQREAIELDRFDEIVVHAATGRHWQRRLEDLGVKRVTNAFPDYGNVLSASIPAGLTTIERSAGARSVMAAGASAGMSFALARFHFDPAVIAD